MYVYMYICRYGCISMYMQVRSLVSKRGFRFNLSNFFGQGNLGATMVRVSWGSGGMLPREIFEKLAL